MKKRRTILIVMLATLMIAVEYATLEWIDWFNHRRILEPIGDIPPAEYETDYYRQTSPADTAGLKQYSLR